MGERKMATKTAKIMVGGKVITITTNGDKKRWYSINAYGLTNRVIWTDTDGNMWVKNRGEWLEVEYRIFGRYDYYTDNTAVSHYYGCRTAKTVN